MKSPLPKLKVVVLDPNSSSVQNVCLAYANNPPDPIVVTFARNPSSPRLWHEALNPPIWAKVFSSELDLIYTDEKSSSVDKSSSILDDSPSSTNAREISTLAFGGSFDGCHEGHLSMLWYCLKILRLDDEPPANFSKPPPISGRRCTLYLGITPQLWVERKPFGKFAYSLESRLSVLRRSIELFLISLNYSKVREEATALHCSIWESLYGSTTVMIHISVLDDCGVGIAGVASDLTHLLVTPDCLKGAEVVNETRLSNSLNPVKFVKCDFLVDERDEALMSRSKIRDEEEKVSEKVSTAALVHKRSSSKIREEVSEKYRIFSQKNDLQICMDIFRSVISPSLTIDGEIRDDWLSSLTRESIYSIMGNFV